MRALLAGALCAALSGCGGGMNYLVQNYGTQPPEVVSTASDQWWVFDKPAEGKILVQKSPAGSALQGLAGGLLMNPGLASSPKPLYQEAAEAHLAQTGRQCRIKDGYLVIEPSWEFTYECGAATASLPRG